MTSRRANGEGSIFPYRNGFAAYVWITTPSGKRQRKYVYGRTREIVHSRWVELTRKAARGPVVTKVPTVGQFLHRWLEDTVAPNLAPLTYATYESHVKNYIEPGIGALRLDRLRIADVQPWLNRLASQCQCCAQGKDACRALHGTARCCAVGKCCHQVASPRTIKDVRTVLRSALHSAVRQELIDRNVAQLVQIPKQRKRKLVPWTSEDARRFLESARSDSNPLYAAYVLVLVLGLRKGEVLGLAWEAVNFEHGTLVPDHQLQRVRRSLLYRETKTPASDAWLPMPEIVVAALTIRREQQERERAAAGEIWQQTTDMPSLIFTGRYGTPIDPRTLNRRFASPKRRPRRSFGKVHQERSGKFQASYIGPDGVRHNAPTTFETRGDASAFLSLMQSKIIQGKWKPAPENVGREALSFAAYANPWLADRDLKPRTRALYRGLLDRRILPALGSKPVASLTPADIRGWHAGQPADQPTARAHAYALLRTILSSAVLDGLLPANPCHIRGASGTTRRHRIEPASMPQLEVILDNMPEQYRLMILLASWCALRFGELTELRRGDLDLSHTRVKVTRGVTWIDGKPTIGAPKSIAGICDVGIPPHLVPAVRQHLQDHVGWGKDALLFSTAHGGKSVAAGPSKSTGSGHARPLGAMIFASTT